MATEEVWEEVVPSTVEQWSEVPLTREEASSQAFRDQKSKESAYPRMGIPQTKTFQEGAAALSYGALQELGKIPGALASLGIGTVKAIDRLGSFGDPLSSGYYRPGQDPLTDFISQKVAESEALIQDPTPKIFEAAGVPTNYPTSPQFQGITGPALASIGEVFGPPLIGASATKIKNMIVGPAPMEAADFARKIRAAVKSPKGNIGSRVESAAENQFADIFHANPNADTIAATPFEGYVESVSTVKRSVQGQLDELRSRIGKTLSGGDEIASALEKEASALKRAGEPAEAVQTLLRRAEDIKGTGTTIDDLQRTTTLANQKRQPFFQKTYTSQGPAIANAENIANKIISETGGGILNKELETVGGEAGATLRKKWADLNLLEQQSLERVNKLINKADPEVQSAAAAALSSSKGVAGLFAMMNGHPSGFIGVTGAVLEKFQRQAARDLNSSNSIITKTYEALRKKPPAAPQAFVLPPAPQVKTLTPQELINLQMARSVAPSQSIPSVQSTGAVLPGPYNPSSIPSSAPGTFQIPSSAQAQAILGKELQSLREQQALQALIQQQRNVGMAQSVLPPSAQGFSPETLQNLIQQNLGTVQALTANPPLRLPVSLPSGAPPSANQIIQDLIQQEAIRKAKEAAGSNIGYF